MEFIEWEDLECAYHDFLRHKRSTISAYEYMQLATRDIFLLKEELENDSYTISTSIAFCVTRPKIREVFAAAPRDRVVHHLLILLFGDMFEELSIDTSFNCRKGKGNSAMTEYINVALKEVGEKGWVCKTDIKSCFMSIDKHILWKMLEPELRKWCNTHSNLQPYTERWVKLWKMVVFHRPELNCEIHGDPKLFERLPPDKTLFKSNGKGLAIGNLTSQILANFYFHNVDKDVANYMLKNHGFYARYMDDVVFVSNNRDAVLQGVYIFFAGLKPLHLQMHPRKFYLQKAYKSISIIGQTHHRGRLYIGNRTVFNVFAKINKFNNLAKGEKWLHNNASHIVASINSYFGFMSKGDTYAIRHNMWKCVSPEIKKIIYCENMKKLKIDEEYVEYRKQDSQYLRKRKFIL